MSASARSPFVVAVLTVFPKTDEQAPLPDALSQLYERIKLGLNNDEAGDFIFNCQMGRGRTTTGMISACLVANLSAWDGTKESLAVLREQTTNPDVPYDAMDGPSEEEAYLQGEVALIQMTANW